VVVVEAMCNGRGRGCGSSCVMIVVVVVVSSCVMVVVVVMTLCDWSWSWWFHNGFDVWAVMAVVVSIPISLSHLLSLLMLTLCAVCAQAVLINSDSYESGAHVDFYDLP
jgi:hypothetical protein